MMLRGERSIYHFDWPRLFNLFIDCNSDLVEMEEDLTSLKQYVSESKVTSRVIHTNSYTDWLQRAFYEHLTVLDRIGKSDIFHIGSDNHFPGEFIFPSLEIDPSDLFLEWLTDHITVYAELGGMFPKLLYKIQKEVQTTMISLFGSNFI